MRRSVPAAGAPVFRGFQRCGFRRCVRNRLGAFAEAQEPSVLDVDDGALHRQLGQAGQLGADVEPGRRREALLLQHGHGGRQAGQAEEPFVPPAPVVAHEVPLAEAAAQAPGLHQAFLLLAGAAGEVAEPDRVLGVYRGHQVLEGLAGGADARLDAGGEFGVDEAAGGLQLADRVHGGGAEGGVLPELRREDEDRALFGGEADVGQPVRFLADPVAGGCRVVGAPARVRHGLDVEAKLAQLAFVAFEHAAEGDVTARGVVVDLFAQLAAAQAVLGVEQGDEQVQEAFCT